jgi:hypothetical protein
MGSLTAHLRRAEGHGRLPFHPECPVCRRERLSGRLSSEGVVTRRAQAAFVVGVLAASAVAPAAVSAQETDQQSEGSAAPEQVSGGERAQTPAFDPGGESTGLPFDAPPAEGAPDPAAGDSGPLEPPPMTDVEAPVADPGDDPGGAQTPEVAPPPAEVPSGSAKQPATSAPPAQIDPAPDAPTAAPVPGTDLETTHEGKRKPERDRASKESGGPLDPAVPVASRPHSPDTPRPPATTAVPEVQAPLPATAVRKVQAPLPATAVRKVQAPLPATAVRKVQAPPPATAVADVQPPPPAAATVGDEDVAVPRDGLHVVQSGESLWAIARGLLGEDASVAAIAREVNRLWERNKARIGTGDPDLLMVGTTLRLK